MFRLLNSFLLTSVACYGPNKGLGSAPPDEEEDEGTGHEVQSYDDDLMGDVLGAFAEVAEKDPNAGAPATQDGETPPGATIAPAEKPAAQPPAKGQQTPSAVKPAKQGQAAPAAKPGAPAKPAPGGEQAPPEGDQNNQPHVGPPTSWSPAAKSQWAQLTPEVRAAIEKREGEVTQGFQKYAELKPFVQMAEAGQTTLPAALTAYTNMENMLRRDPDAGMMEVAKNLGWTQAEAAKHFARIAGRLGYQFASPQPAPNNQGQQPGQVPPNGGQGQGYDIEFDPLAAAIRPFIEPIQQQVGQVVNHFQGQQQIAHQYRVRTSEEIAATFAADPQNKYYANVEPLVAQLLTNGTVPRTADMKADLQEAYTLACRIDANVSQAIFNERLAADEAARRTAEEERTRKASSASRSITGSPPGSPNPNRQRQPGVSYDDDLMNDVAAAYGAVSGTG